MEELELYNLGYVPKEARLLGPNDYLLINKSLSLYLVKTYFFVGPLLW